MQSRDNLAFPFGNSLYNEQLKTAGNMVLPKARQMEYYKTFLLNLNLGISVER